MQLDQLVSKFQEKGENKLFTIENANVSEAFGITLEPEGRNASPTLEQLYTLDVVATIP